MNNNVWINSANQKFFNIIIEILSFYDFNKEHLLYLINNEFEFDRSFYIKELFSHNNHICISMDDKYYFLTFQKTNTILFQINKYIYENMKIYLGTDKFYLFIEFYSIYDLIYINIKIKPKYNINNIIEIIINTLYSKIDTNKELVSFNNKLKIIKNYIIEIFDKSILSNYTILESTIYLPHNMIPIKFNNGLFSKISYELINILKINSRVIELNVTYCNKINNNIYVNIRKI